MLPATEEFLAELRRQADRHGFLLIFDEVMTYRLGLNGVQGRVGIRPDLTALAKIIGGGLPVGALIGRPDLLEVLAPPEHARIHHAGTFNGNPLTMAAGCAALDYYGSEQVDALNKSGDELRDALNAGLTAVGFSASGIGSLLNVHGSPTPPRTWRDVLQSDRAAVAEVQRRLRDRGMFIAPRGMMALSTAHSAAELATVEREIIDACRSVA
jgi:glutamate-1-semialdehyde 2,1-aminomutase